MLSYRLGPFNDFHWGFKPILSYGRSLNLSTCIRSSTISRYTKINVVVRWAYVELKKNHIPFNIIYGEVFVCIIEHIEAKHCIVVKIPPQF